MTKGYVPKLRFNKFNNYKWINRKAGNLFRSISEKRHPTLPVLSVTQKHGLMYRKDLNSDIKYSTKSLPNYKVIHPGDFVISLRSFQGGFECSNKLGISSPAYTVFNFNDKSKYYTYYWKVYFKTYNFLQLLKKITFGIRDGRSIKFKGFESLYLKYPPNYQEQYKIGHFFATLDKLICLQRSKLDLLKKQKRGYLQKLFPKHNDTMPRYRFSGFHDKWHTFLLDDLYKRCDNLRKPVSANKRVKGNTPYYGANGVEDYVKGYTCNGDYVLIAEDGANSITNYPVYRVSGKFWVNNHAHILSSRENSSIDFLTFAFKCIYMRTYLVGGGRLKLRSKDLMSIHIKAPSLAEQHLIGQFFKRLDDNISLQNDKLNYLRKLKKAYLQKMFC